LFVGLWQIWRWKSNTCSNIKSILTVNQYIIVRDEIICAKPTTIYIIFFIFYSLLTQFSASTGLGLLVSDSLKSLHFHSPCMSVISCCFQKPTVATPFLWVYVTTYFFYFRIIEYCSCAVLSSAAAKLLSFLSAPFLYHYLIRPFVGLNFMRLQYCNLGYYFTKILLNYSTLFNLPSLVCSLCLSYCI
jgi:hypothetical protein